VIVTGHGLLADLHRSTDRVCDLEKNKALHLHECTANTKEHKVRHSQTMNDGRNCRNKIYKGQSRRGTFLIEQTLDPSGNPGPRNPLPSCPVLIERAFCSQPNILVFLFLYQPPGLVPPCVVPPTPPRSRSFLLCPFPEQFTFPNT